MADLSLVNAPILVSHPERVVYKKDAITKQDVAEYYASVAQWMLPEIARRPISLLRCPDGAGKSCFFQKHYAESLGDSVYSVELMQKSGEKQFVYINDENGLLQLVQMNVLEFHPWGTKIDFAEECDRLVFDLDPGDGVAWTSIKKAAREIRQYLQQTGLESYVRLSGGKGLHIVVPLSPASGWEDAKSFCKLFAETMQSYAPEKYIATMSKSERHGKIFIDWLRNTYCATSVASWSLRAREHATVAVPIRWDELAKVTSPATYTLSKAIRHARKLQSDPWEGIDSLQQSLPEVIAN